MRQVVVKELVQFGIRYDAAEAIELAFLQDLPRRLDEGMHGDARERATHADTTYAECGEVIHRVAERAAVKEIDRLRCDGFDRCR